MGKTGVKKGRKGRTALAASMIFAGLVSATAPAYAEDMPDSPITYDADTVTSRYVAAMQEQFGNSAFHPVIVLDRTWFDVNTALQNITVELYQYGNTETALMKSFMEQRLGQEVPQAIAGLFYKDMTIGLAQALFHNYPGSKFWVSVDQAGPYCLLYPDVPNLDNIYRTQFAIYYRPEIYGSLYGYDIHPLTSADRQMKQFDYHELAHCLDDRYMLDYQQGRANGSTEIFMTNRHLIELKGELLGILLMTKFEGGGDLARSQSTLRYLDSWFRGRALNLGAQDEFAAFMGATYALGPALETLQTEIDRIGLDHIRDMTVAELAALADTVAEAAQLSWENKEALLEAYDSPESMVRNNEFIRDYLDKVIAAFVTVTGGAVEADTVRQAIYRERPQPVADHYQYVPFDDGDETTRTQRMETVRDALVAEAGSNPTLQDFIRAYAALYDRYIAIIENGDKAERLEAMRNTNVLQNALRSAIYDLPQNAALAPASLTLSH